jgi:hypothetical protein
MQGRLVLAVGKFHIKHPAVGLKHRQRIKFSFSVAVYKRSEVAPIDLHLFTGR